LIGWRITLQQARREFNPAMRCQRLSRLNAIVCIQAGARASRDSILQDFNAIVSL
jgi:hypothetical protein